MQLKHWLVLLVFAIAGVAAALYIHETMNQFEVEAQLISTASHQAHRTRLPWERRSESDIESQSKREIKDLSLLLRSHDLVGDFLTRRCAAGNAASFCKEYGDENAVNRLMGGLSSVIEDARLLRIRVRAKSAESAVDLANALAEDLLTQKDRLVQASAADFLKVLGAEKREQEIRLQIALENLLESAGRSSGPTLHGNSDDHLRFLAQLQEKAAELDMKIAENRDLIEMIGQQARGAEQDYGPAMRLSELQKENKILQGRRKIVVKQVSQGLSENYSIPQGETAPAQTKEQFRTALRNYGDLIREIERVQLAVSVAEKPVDHFQKANLHLVRDRWPLELLLAAGLFLSQLFGAAAILIFRLWQDDVVPIKRPLYSPGIAQPTAVAHAEG